MKNAHLLSREDVEFQDSIDLIDIFLILWKRKFFILLFVLSVSTATAYHQLFVAPEVFRSEAKLLPIKSTGSKGMLGQLGGLANFVGMSATKEENTLEIILKSRTLAEELVTEYDLNKKWKISFQEAVEVTRQKLFIGISKKVSLITVAWKDTDPAFAQELVSHVLVIAADRVAAYSSRKKNSQIEFLKKRVSVAGKELRQSENDLRNFQVENEGVEIEKQAGALISQIQELRIEHQRKEIELAVSRGNLSNDASEIKRLELTVAELKTKMSQLIGNGISEDKAFVKEMGLRSLMEIPSIGLEYSRRLRRVKLNQKIYGTLLEQLELAKIEAQKDIESFEVIDPPLVPERRISPKRSLTVALSGMSSGIFAVMLVLLNHFFVSIKLQKLKG